MPRLLALMLTGLVFAGACSGGGGSKAPTSTAAVTQPPTAASTPSPSGIPAVRVPNVAPSSDIALPAGFHAYKIAGGFLHATSVVPAPDGSIFLSEEAGTVYRLTDTNGDGVFEQRVVFTSGFPTTTGIALAPDGTLYVSSRGSITTVRDTNNDGVGDDSLRIITGLPVGRHQNNGLTIGPDNKLYFTNGSDCDDCVEADPRSATIQQSNLDGSASRVYAKGLRNSYDLVFDSSGRLWATDNGSDAPCATTDELDLIVDGGDYGWPYGQDGCNNKTDHTPPVASLGLHTASTGVAAYDADQFPGYRGDVFATLWGGGVGAPDPADYQATLVRVEVNGSNGTVSVFGSGFKHPIDVALDRDGSLLVVDYGSDNPDATLYRILYTGQ